MTTPLLARSINIISNTIHPNHRLLIDHFLTELTVASPPSVVGTVGLLTACLAVLAFSQTTIAMCGGSPEVNEQHAPTRRSSMRQFDIDAAVGDGEIHPSRAPRAIQRANGEHPDEMSSAGMRLEGLQDRGAWEQWESWDSSERHAFAAILVRFLPTGTRVIGGSIFVETTRARKLMASNLAQACTRGGARRRAITCWRDISFLHAASRAMRHTGANLTSAYFALHA